MYIVKLTLSISFFNVELSTSAVSLSKFSWVALIICLCFPVEITLCASSSWARSWTISVSISSICTAPRRCNSLFLAWCCLCNDSSCCRKKGRILHAEISTLQLVDSPLVLLVAPSPARRWALCSPAIVAGRSKQLALHLALSEQEALVSCKPSQTLTHLF